MLLPVIIIVVVAIPVLVMAFRATQRTKAEVHRTHNTGYNCRHCLNHGTCGEAKVA